MTEVQWKEGDTVYLFMPAKLTEETQKLNWPNEGLYCIVRVGNTYAEIVKKGQSKKKFYMWPGNASRSARLKC